MKKLFVYGSFLLLLIACKNDQTTISEDKSPLPTTDTSRTSTPAIDDSTTSTHNGWTDMQRTAFLKDCTVSMTNTMEQSKAADYCACMGERMEKAHPRYDEVAKMSEADLMKMATDCFK